MTRRMQNDCKPRPGAQRAEAIALRIREKLGDYDSYEFTEPQSGALNIFFDLVQEFEPEEDFHAICVMVPKVLFGLDCALYLVTKTLSLRCAGASGPDTVHPHRALPGRRPAPVHTDVQDGHFYFPIRANAAHIEQLPFTPPENVIGCLEIFPAAKLVDGDSLFWEKYANRIGFQMHNRIVHGASKRHLRFIRSLAKDIGHNVIVPNMYFKLFFNRLKRTIDQLGALPERHTEPTAESRRELLDLHQALHDQYEEISRHYEQTSLYLETLLRQSHFEKGHYVLEKRPCHVPSQIIEPQLHQFLQRYEERGISVTPCAGYVDDKDMILSVDVGLIAQVFSNLFSNALKYAAPPEGGGGARVSCSARLERGRLGRGKDAVVFTVFSTGRPIPPATGAKLFRAGFRAEGDGVEGTGHGLYFVKQIVQMHGGKAEHEACAEGNSFLVILPVQPRAKDGEP